MAVRVGSSLAFLLFCIPFFTAVASAGEAFTDSVTGMAFVFVRGGPFDRGDWTGEGRENERPIRREEVRAFYLGRTEVTVAQYRRFAEESGHRTRAEVKGSVVDIEANMAQWKERKGISWRTPGFPQTSDDPVVWVDEDDADAFAAWLSKKTGRRYRLPTEAEWEYAARSGGKPDRWAGTSDPASLTRYAWYAENSGGVTHPVGQKLSNGLGLVDMSGNVWEWCGSGSASEPAPFLRGGSWRVPAGIASTTYRSSYRKDYAHSSIGFRLAVDAEP